MLVFCTSVCFASFSLFFTAIRWNQPWRECIVWNTQKKTWKSKALLAKVRFNLFWKLLLLLSLHVLTLSSENRAPPPGPAVVSALICICCATITDWRRITAGGMGLYIITPAEDQRLCIQALTAAILIFYLITCHCFNVKQNINWCGWLHFSCSLLNEKKKKVFTLFPLVNVYACLNLNVHLP